MQKTVCDSCGKDINGYRMVVEVTILHSTSDDEHVGSDRFSDIDLCSVCATSPVSVLTLAQARPSRRGGRAVIVESGDSEAPMRAAYDPAVRALASPA